MRPSSSIAALSLLFFAAALPACAQPRASQHGAVSQTVNTTTIALEYDRPSVRGRTIFGDILEYGVVWTPGANRATWIEFSEPVTIGGQSVDAGRYGVWTLPGEREWEVVLVREWDTHHSFFPHETEAARFRAPAVDGAHMEALAFYFPVVGPYETTLALHWGTHVVHVPIEVGR